MPRSIRSRASARGRHCRSWRCACRSRRSIFSQASSSLPGWAWRDGSAVALVLRDNTYAGTPMGLYLADHFPALLGAVTYAVIGLQVLLPLLIYSPWRNDLTRGIALAGLAAMHLSFIVLLDIDGFPLMSMAA